jgi:hypothetical protein
VGSWFLFTARTPSPSACLFCRLALSGGVLFPLPLGHHARREQPWMPGGDGACGGGHRQAAIALLSGRQSAARQLPLPAPCCRCGLSLSYRHGSTPRIMYVVRMLAYLDVLMLLALSTNSLLSVLRTTPAGPGVQAPPLALLSPLSSQSNLHTTVYLFSCTTSTSSRGRKIPPT